MAYRNKTYIAFDGDNDIRYYNLMKTWSNNSNSNFNLYDAHDLNITYDTSLEESIKSQLRKRFQESKILILLIGENTYRLTKFVKWEIETAKKLNIPIILVVLNENNIIPNWFLNYPAVKVPFNQSRIQFAINNWPIFLEKNKSRKYTGVWHY